MQPLKITAYPRVGIEADAYLPIDGVFYALAMRREYGPEMLTVSGQATAADPMPLPLERRGTGDAWYYAASFAQWGPHVDYRSFWVKRYDRGPDDLIDFGGRVGRVHTESGRYKNYHTSTYLRHALHLSWYVVGDRTAIVELLDHAGHIGKKVSQGNGRIARWDIEPWPEDWSVYGAGGRLMRAIPADDGVLHGIRPSYWLPSNQTLCRLPGDHNGGRR